ncbi:MAG: hypothetical protein JXR05_10345 [Flavobacteriaceae bacterium]
MKKNLFIMLFFVVTVSFAQKEEDLVKEAFKKYKSLILNDKGSEAVNYLSSKTLDYYQSMLEKTKVADSLEVNELSVIDKIFVLSIKYNTPKEKIESFNSNSLIVYAIDEGMIGKNSVTGADIGEVEIDNDFARGQFVVNGQPTPVYFHFYKEEGKWRIDLTSIFPLASVGLDKIIKESGEEENRFIVKLLNVVDSEVPKNNLWKPVSKMTPLRYKKLTCIDFKKGTFFNPVDSIVKKKITIVRKDSTQIESVEGEERVVYETIEWIDDCTYRLKFDSSKMELNDFQVWANKNNGLVVRKLKIEGKCMIYSATMTTEEGKKLTQKAKLCKN